MKTYGLIWPDGQKELRSIVLDDEGNPRLDTLEPNPKPEDWQPPQVLPLLKLPQPEQGAWEPNAVWFDDRVERQWVAGTPAPAPTFTAEQWLDTQGLSLSRTPVFLYLRQSGAQSPKLDATEAYLNGILAQFAADTSPRTAEAWGAAPWSFEEVVGEALGVLQQ